MATCTCSYMLEKDALKKYILYISHCRLKYLKLLLQYSKSQIVKMCFKTILNKRRTLSDHIRAYGQQLNKSSVQFHFSCNWGQLTEWPECPESRGWHQEVKNVLCRLTLQYLVNIQNRFKSSLEVSAMQPGQRRCDSSLTPVSTLALHSGWAVGELKSIWAVEKKFTVVRKRSDQCVDNNCQIILVTDWKKVKETAPDNCTNQLDCLWHSLF